MKRFLSTTLKHLICRGTPEAVAARISGMTAHYVQRQGPEFGLRMLMELDARLYQQQGVTASAREGGIHPKHRLMSYHDFFVARIAEGETVLDIGCGHGALAHSLASGSGARVTGIDMSASNIQKARERHSHEHIEFIHGDALVSLPQRHFDVVVMSNVLEHIEHRVEFVRRVNDLVHPRRWLIRVPVFERDWRVPLKRELGIEWRLDDTHFTEFTIESFEQEMGQAAMSVVHLEIRWSEIWSELTPITMHQ